jgi:hypothetical protein
MSEVGLKRDDTGRKGSDGMESFLLEVRTGVRKRGDILVRTGDGRESGPKGVGPGVGRRDDLGKERGDGVGVKWADRRFWVVLSRRKTDRSLVDPENLLLRVLADVALSQERENSVDGWERRNHNHISVREIGRNETREIDKANPWSGGR